MDKLNRNKAAVGPDGIVTEMLLDLDDFGIYNITTEINELYKSGNIPEDLSKFIFVALPKRLCENEYQLQRTIILTKLRTTMLRINKA